MKIERGLQKQGLNCKKNMEVPTKRFKVHSPHKYNKNRISSSLETMDPWLSLRYERWWNRQKVTLSSFMICMIPK